MRIALLVFLACAGVACAGTRLKFQIPAGWLDLSPGAPAANFAKCPPQFLPQTRMPEVVALAVDVDHAGAFTMNLNVRTMPSGGVLDEAAVATIGRELERQFPLAIPGAKYRVLTHRVVHVQSVACGRCEGELTVGTSTVKQLLYVFPEGEQASLLTVSGDPAQYEKNIAEWDALAQATTGLAAPPSTFARVMAGAGSGAVKGGLIGLAVALALGLVNRKKPGK